jgi:hypothetical protein
VEFFPLFLFNCAIDEKISGISVGIIEEKGRVGIRGAMVRDRNTKKIYMEDRDTSVYFTMMGIYFLWPS